MDMKELGYSNEAVYTYKENLDVSSADLIDYNTATNSNITDSSNKDTTVDMYDLVNIYIKSYDGTGTLIPSPYDLEQVGYRDVIIGSGNIGNKVEKALIGHHPGDKISYETRKPITKSGLNHRFRKISELIERIKKNS